MKRSIKATLAGLVLAATLGATACGGSVNSQPPEQVKTPARVTVVGTPTGDAHRSVVVYPTYNSASSHVMGSYTFSLDVAGKTACASYGRVGARDDPSPISDAEYDAMVISGAAKDRRPVTFQAEGFTGNGCYIMVSRPGLTETPR